MRIDSDVSGHQQEVKDGTASKAAPAISTCVEMIDVEALVQIAVHQIANAVAPAVVPLLAEELESQRSDNGEHITTEVDSVAHPAAVASELINPSTWEAEAVVLPVQAEREIEVVATKATAEHEEAPVGDEVANLRPTDLNYVPNTKDRILTQPGRSPVEHRIEPTFEMPSRSTEPPSEDALDNPSLSAEPYRADEASVSPGRRLLSGRWTWRRVFRLAGLAVAAYFGVIVFLILLYRFINPPTTTLIAYQWLTGTKIEQEWVPIEDISSNLLRAVVVSEDWGFCDHYGIDLDAIEKALEQAGEGKMARGASTISMQVIKNLFLSQSKSYLRKAVEIPLTFAAEAVWPKSRMLEIYLNIAEWGPGVFGAEAAALHHFSKPASKLTQREAALLAAALPNPILRDAGDPSTRTARKASVIQARMRVAGPVADCAMTGRQRSSQVNGTANPGWLTTVKKRAGADGSL